MGHNTFLANQTSRTLSFQSNDQMLFLSDTKRQGEDKSQGLDNAFECSSLSSLVSLKNKKPTRFHLLFYCISYRLNMFRALLCPSSGARDYNVDYHIGRIVLYNTSNYQPTNETHYTKHNSTTITHKRSQLLIQQTRCQLQQNDKELHTEHTPLRTINLH